MRNLIKPTSLLPLILPLVLSVYACDQSAITNGETAQAVHIDSENQIKPAFFMTKTYDPILDMLGVTDVIDARYKAGEAGKIVTYEHCIQNTSPQSIEPIYNLFAEQKAYEDKQLAAAKEEGASYSSPPTSITQITLMQYCPPSSNAFCDKGTTEEHYYTSSSVVLGQMKKQCEASGLDTWQRIH